MVQKRVENTTKSTKTIRKLLKRIKRLERTINTIELKLSLYEEENSYEHSFLRKRVDFLENGSIPF